MPVTKTAASRFRIIDACLTSRVKRYWSIEEILLRLREDDIPVSRRTLEADIESLRYDERLGYFAPIRYCKRNKGFHYAELSYTLTKVAFTASDFDTLRMVYEFVKTFGHNPAAGRFRDLVNRLRTSFDKKAGDLDTGIDTPPCPDDIATYVTQALLNAVRNATVVKIFLTAPTAGERRSFFFHPYYLHSNGSSSLSVYGLIEQHEQQRTSIDLTTIDEVVATTRASIPYDANFPA